MTSDFTAAVAAMLKGDAVGFAYGVTFDFTSGPVSLWQGFGDLDTSAFADGYGGTGPVFKGFGALGSVSTVEIGSNAATQSLVYELSGVEAKYSALARNQGPEMNGRRARLYFLFFDSAGGLLDMRLRRTTMMDRMTTKIITSTNPPTMKIELSTEPLMSDKHKSPWAFLTDGDQQARFPGDRALERQGEVAVNQTIIW